MAISAPAAPYPQSGFKFNYKKFVPAPSKTKKSQAADLQSMFGSHSDDEDAEREQRKQITVNRKTNIHYAIHRRGEKSL